MGPLASAEFLSTIYRLSLGRTEQEMPRLCLISDPTIPDRTSAILEGEYESVVHALECLLKRLSAMQVDHIVVPCITAHFFFPRLRLPGEITSRLLSLLDVVFDSLLADGRRYLLLCTSGTRKAQIFQSDRRWQEATWRQLVDLPDMDDQEKIHAYLYDMKKTWQTGDLTLLDGLAKKYQVQGFIAGCTEMHLQARELTSSGMHVLDPLTILAHRIANSNS